MGGGGGGGGMIYFVTPALPIYLRRGIQTEILNRMTMWKYFFAFRQMRPCTLLQAQQGEEIQSLMCGEKCVLSGAAPAANKPTNAH